MKQNPCRYCSSSYEYKGRHIAGWICRGNCEHYKKHQQYLESQRKFKIGERITSMDELMEQERVYIGMSRVSKSIEIIKSWQYRSIVSVLERGGFYKAIRKGVKNE